MMKTYLVGGAVRDKFLGLVAKDLDFCVVGSSAEEMLKLGYKSVGKDFPVFLHPTSGDEYALARIERKSGHGYSGFAVDTSNSVTLEDDLSRRDLTINAMAMDSSGLLIDPYGGLKDLKAGIFRHVSDAFAEDPVRVLRVARFAARYPTFKVAEETKELMQSMVLAGEVDHLVSERVWQEISKGLMEKKPSRMFEVLRECSALAKILPEVDDLHGVIQPKEHHPEIDTLVHVLMTVDHAAQADMSLNVRFACLMHDLGKALSPKDKLPSHHGHEEAGGPLIQRVCDRLRVPSGCRELAILAGAYHTHVHRANVLNPTSVVKLLKNTDAFRRPERFSEFLQACKMDAQGRLGLSETPYPQAARMEEALKAANTVDVASVAQGTRDPRFIPDNIHAARVRAVKQFIFPDEFDRQNNQLTRHTNNG